MATERGKLNGISVKTARMLEIYSLLIDELKRGGEISLSSEDQNRLNEAIRTISKNMQQIQSTCVNDGVKISPDLESAVSEQGQLNNLDDIVDAVLKWHIADQNEE